MPDVMKALGLKPKESVAAKAARKAGAAGQAKTATVKDLAQQIKILETVALQLEKTHTKGSAETQDAAFQVKTAAEKVLANMSPQASAGRSQHGVDEQGRPKHGFKPMATLGPEAVALHNRLVQVIERMQLIWDEHLVAMTKKKAGEIYLGAGQDAVGGGTSTAPGANRGGFAKTGGFVHLTKGAKDAFMDAPQFNEVKGPRQEAERLGLSRAHIAAIVTMTVEDYRYINPAVNNDMEWMKKQNAAPDFADKPDLTPAEQQALKDSLAATGMKLHERHRERKAELASRRSEGALHQGMLLEALLKLPVWPAGKLYRGEVLTQADFERRFPVDAKGKYRTDEPTFTVKNAQSRSKSPQEAKNIWTVAGPRVPPPRVNILWETTVTNGRDLELLSANKKEQEVATLPGAMFKITSLEMVKVKGTKQNAYFLIKAKQIS